MARFEGFERWREGRDLPINVTAEQGRRVLQPAALWMHDENGRICRRYNGKRWIACRLEFKDCHRHPLLQPGRFTELFFLDEATAFAAGHRPCALCRRQDYTRFIEIWRELHPGQIGADAIDAQLHIERVDPLIRTQRHHEGPLDELPDGAFVLRDRTPWLVLDRHLLRWTPAGYIERAMRPARQQATVITPPSLIEILRVGWRPVVPLVHPKPQSVGVRAPPPAERGRPMLRSL